MDQETYKLQLESEKEGLDPSSHSSRLITQELERIESGSSTEKDKERPKLQLVDIHTTRQQKVQAKIRVPSKEFPAYNFVGKLLGPQGSTLKLLQQETGVKMSILGRGSVRDKKKEDDLRKEGGKYAHLNDELHVCIEVFGDPSDAYTRISRAVGELRQYLIPDPNEPGGFEMQGQMNGDEMGQGRGRGGRGRGMPPGLSPGRGGMGGAPRGGFSRGGGAPIGRGGPLLVTPGGRGAPSSRGAPRGAPGGMLPPRGRGGPPTRGMRAPAPAPEYHQPARSYERISQYEDPYADAYAPPARAAPVYEDPYPSETPAYIDYGHGSSAADLYDDGYGAPPPRYAPRESPYAMKALPTRGKPSPFRPHPYGSRGGY